MADIEQHRYWYHLQIWCYGQWLPGDSRGFRSHHGRYISTGDYKQPPRKGEHAGLYQNARNSLKHPPTTLSIQQREIVGKHLLQYCRLKQIPILALSMGERHGHALVACDFAQDGLILGKMKRYATIESRRVDHSLPTPLFGRRSENPRCRTYQHLNAAFHYILEHLHQDHWVWAHAHEHFDARSAYFFNFEIDQLWDTGRIVRKGEL